MTGVLTAEDFEPHCNTGFEVSVDGYSDIFTLVEVQRQKHPTPAPRPPFTLFFVGQRKDAMFNQQLIEMKHPEMGELTIFIVPIGKTLDETFEYQAVFN